MVYVVIKDLSRIAEDTIMITSSISHYLLWTLLMMQ